jgi:hypothetical protein
MTINQGHHIADSQGRQSLVVAGGLLGAFAADAKANVNQLTSATIKAGYPFAPKS